MIPKPAKPPLSPTSAPAIWREEYAGSAISKKLYYLHRDYLGSILAITDQSGALKEKRHFDAWGNIVKLTDGAGAALDYFVILDRGYTGHEHLFGVGLIHMNGRLYDPVLHRFLSPDNYVQEPFNTQSFNRFGYALNNPLMYTDPDGEFFVAALIGAAIGIITNGINNVVHDRPFFKGAGKAALFGAVGGAASFGIGTIATNIAESAGAFVSSAFQAGAHSVLGGVVSAVDGGNFWSGVLAGGISSVVASSINITGIKSETWSAVAGVGGGAVSGGIGSVIGGGNFWAGFRQGAITSGLNHLAHSTLQRKQEQPRWDKNGNGRLELREANLWYKDGNGEAISVDAQSVDLDFIDPSQWEVGQTQAVKTLLTSRDGRVFGQLKLTYHGKNQFSINDNAFDFDYHPNGGWFRNTATQVGNWFAGQGKGYMIQFTGFNTVKYMGNNFINK